MFASRANRAIDFAKRMGWQLRGYCPNAHGVLVARNEHGQLAMFTFDDNDKLVKVVYYNASGSTPRHWVFT
jgi:hypothetical protein